MAPVDAKKRETLGTHLRNFADLLGHIDNEISCQFRALSDWLLEDSNLGLSSLRAALKDALKQRSAESGPVAAAQSGDGVLEFFNEFTYEQGSERCCLTEEEITNATTVAKSIKVGEAAKSTVKKFLNEYDAEPESFWGKFHGNEECDKITKISDALDHFSSQSSDIARRVLSRGLRGAVQDEAKELKRSGAQLARGQSYRDLALKNAYSRSKLAPRHITASEKWSVLEPGVVIGITAPNWTIWDRQISLRAVRAVNAYLENTGSMAEYRKASYLVEKIQLAFGSRKRKSSENYQGIASFGESNNPERPTNRRRISPESSPTDSEGSHSSPESRSRASTEDVPGIRIDQAANRKASRSTPFTKHDVDKVFSMSMLGHQNVQRSSIATDDTPRNQPSQAHLPCTQGSQRDHEDISATHPSSEQAVICPSDNLTLDAETNREVDKLPNEALSSNATFHPPFPPDESHRSRESSISGHQRTEENVRSTGYLNEADSQAAETLSGLRSGCDTLNADGGHCFPRSSDDVPQLLASSASNMQPSNLNPVNGHQNTTNVVAGNITYPKGYLINPDSTGRFMTNSTFCAHGTDNWETGDRMQELQQNNTSTPYDANNRSLSNQQPLYPALVSDLDIDFRNSVGPIGDLDLDWLESFRPTSDLDMDWRNSLELVDDLDLDWTN